MKFKSIYRVIFCTNYYSHVTLKAQIIIRLLKFSSNELVLILDGWPLRRLVTTSMVSNLRAVNQTNKSFIFIIKLCWQHRVPWISLVIASGRSSRLHTELIFVSLCRLADTDASMCRSPLKNVAYEFVLTSLAVPSMSCSCYLHSLCDGGG